MAGSAIRVGCITLLYYAVVVAASAVKHPVWGTAPPVANPSVAPIANANEPHPIWGQTGSGGQSAGGSGPTALSGPTTCQPQPEILPGPHMDFAKEPLDKRVLALKLLFPATFNSFQELTAMAKSPAAFFTSRDQQQLLQRYVNVAEAFNGLYFHILLAKSLNYVIPLLDPARRSQLRGVDNQQDLARKVCRVYLELKQLQGMMETMNALSAHPPAPLHPNDKPLLGEIVMPLYLQKEQTRAAWQPQAPVQAANPFWFGAGPAVIPGGTHIHGHNVAAMVHGFQPIRVKQPAKQQAKQQAKPAKQPAKQPPRKPAPTTKPPSKPAPSRPQRPAPTSAPKPAPTQAPTRQSLLSQAKAKAQSLWRKFTGRK